ncbi:translocation protein TolB [Streptomyces agglomeratus]|uniref:alkaline phosphatase PhoX n=1 Tax=Streptomyces agglomeratus TaxID=285458 RepID=UPI00085400B3|nr:alkaline phosphatase PhoX [Streptomyces agglomeratus]OEJ38975.1 translocation protein TolB [Streptomyces agglomeratus]OEJ46642.1 translocation protein TolB [Streptomyces agglomeratus]OEJ51505.1 translocation protein TolB [Streptomyces agglomeratus]OEJ58906.1 translocation protein TolB [Streptomyces agglomeratus]
MERRSFLRGAVIGTSVAAFGGSLWRGAAYADPAQPGAGPYGGLGSADANGIRLPSGFSSRVIARSGQKVGSTAYTWHNAPDGGACYADGTGWIYVSNSEISPSGGAGAVRFSSTGAITGAYRILSSTRQNCAGGKTPWNTWLSCEEVDRGYVYETDPWGVKAAVRRDAMGRFKHEAAAADPVRRTIYLTEDVTDGCFYRFTPTTWGDLSSGRLEVLKMGSGTSGPVTWATVPDPSGATATRNQVSGAKRFNGGEGCYYADDVCYFTTKGDNRVWQYNAAAQTIELAYDDSLVSGTAPLTGVDNVTGTASGDLFVAEDGGTMEICVITPDDVVAPFLRIDGQSGSEICGPAFSPDGRRLYFSSQRGTSGSSSGGITYEVTGPFRA